MKLQYKRYSIKKILSEDINNHNITNIIYKWNQFRKEYNDIHNLGWSKQIKRYDYKMVKKLYNFREALKKYIMKRCNICTDNVCSKCQAVGSNKLTSDIDISINTEINFSISINRLIILLNDLHKIFTYDKLFHNNKGVFELKLVHKFFDINFYISNFELVKNPEAKIDDFERYYISGYYKKSKNIINQYYFAFIEFILLEYKNKNIGKRNIIKYRKDMNEYMKLINELNNLLKGYANSNKIVNIISILSLYEDDSYHSQGSYFHVVMMLQKKITFKIKTKKDRQIYRDLLSASIIENLCFSYCNRNKKEKYLSRVKDCFHRLNKYKIKNSIFNSLEKNINKLNNPRAIRYQIYILLNNLGILVK